MFTMAKKQYGDVIDLEKYAKDTRLTEPSDGRRYEWKEMIERVKQLRRPLTEKESEKYRMK
ncbi:MAG: hypothetical protein PHV18_12375 [Lachnospiraceae bacterium]|nr:hypothetical protein [Lachnospiraceae bacterium]